VYGTAGTPDKAVDSFSATPEHRTFIPVIPKAVQHDGVCPAFCCRVHNSGFIRRTAYPSHRAATARNDIAEMITLMSEDASIND
jgi:hypothetical protein